tara:strand:- start:332 stop:649 length:318 start_codon:yes stop_codon:yes gene_type:complete
MTEDTTYGNEIGKVIWFDRRLGYGFIHIIQGDHIDKEVFCHYSNIQSESPYKRLIPGECVSLTIVENPEEKDENKRLSSNNISGLFGSELMCENNKYIYKIVTKR